MDLAPTKSVYNSNGFLLHKTRKKKKITKKMMIIERVILTSVLKAITNKSFKKIFDINFMRNRKNCQNIYIFSFLIKTFFKIVH